MEAIKLIIQVIAAIAGSLLAIMSIPLFLRFRWPAAAMWGLKVFVSAFSRLLAFMAALVTIAGLATGSLFISLVGLYAFFIYCIHIFLVTRPPGSSENFEQAFGLDWERQISPQQKKSFLRSRIVLKLPVVANARMEQNLVFATIPGTSRKLYCDVWQPPVGIPGSGLAYIYLHGSAFYFLDKDLGTRPMFNYLAAQGHVIMDVAYRLAPETDILGMVNDVKRAIAWLKENADNYRVDPNRIVVGGASAGASLGLLAAYTIHNAAFSTKELEGKDDSVCAVISLYGPTDLVSLYYHTNQHLTTRNIPGRPRKKVPTKMPGWLKKRIGNDYHRLGMDKGFESAGTLAPIMGGHPDECPEAYTFLSPLTHVHANCPPTLLIHGEHDIMSPVKTTRILHSLLLAEKVPAVLHILPQTDHAFDLVMLKISPAGHNALYDVERFLAIIAAGTEQNSFSMITTSSAITHAGLQQSSSLK